MNPWRRALMALLLAGLVTGCVSRVEDGAAGTLVDEDRRFSRADLLEDLAYMFDAIHEIHPRPYHRVDSLVVERARQRVEDALRDSMGSTGFWRLAAPLVGMLRDGHTSLTVPRADIERTMSSGATLFPLLLYIDSGGARIRSDLSDEQLFAVGSRVLAINGRPIVELIHEGTATQSFERDVLRERVLERSIAEMIPLVWGWTGPFAVEVESPSGEGRTRTVAGITRDSWRARVDSAGLLGGPFDPYTYTTLAGGAVGYIDLRAHVDPRRFGRFLRETFTRLTDRSPCALVIDVRRNGGGSSALTDQLTAYLTRRPVRQYSRVEVRASSRVKADHRRRLPRVVRWMPGPVFRPVDVRFSALLTAADGDIVSWTEREQVPKRTPLHWSGPVYVLTGVNTFSSAADLAAALQDYGIATIVGQETGGLASSYGEFLQTALPHTRLRLNVSFKYFVRPSGIEDGRGVVPDVPVPEARDATGQNDPAVARILELLDPSCGSHF